MSDRDNVIILIANLKYYIIVIQLQYNCILVSSKKTCIGMIHRLFLPPFQFSFKFSLFSLVRTSLNITDSTRCMAERDQDAIIINYSYLTVFCFVVFVGI